MRADTARTVLPAVAVLALVAIVAIAATGSTPTGSGDARAPGDLVLDAVFTVGLFMLVPGALLLIYGLLQRKAIARELASGRYRRLTFFTFTVFMVLFGIAVYFRMRNWRRPAPQDEELDPASPPLVPELVPDPSETTYEPELALVPLLVVAALAGIGILAAVLAARRREAALDESELLTEELVAVLTDTLDDLRAESDPRRAIIAAYARFDRVLAAHGFPRRPSETPEEFLRRMLRALEVGEESARRLTTLFERAKFSHHAVDPAMKEEAIDALEQLRDELRPKPDASAQQPATFQTGRA